MTEIFYFLTMFLNLKSFVLCPKIPLQLEYKDFGGNLHNYSMILPYSW